MSRNADATSNVIADKLKIGDVIIFRRKRAEILNVQSWNDVVHSTVYGVDLMVKSKQERTSFVASGRVELVA